MQLQAWNRSQSWLTFQPQRTTPFPAFTDQLQFFERKFNSHFPEAVENSFLFMSYTHYPEPHLLSMGQKPTIISLMIHKHSTYTKLHHPTGLHKEISESPHSLIPLFHTRNEKDKILDSPSILTSFNNTNNTKFYSPTR